MKRNRKLEQNFYDLRKLYEETKAQSIHDDNDKFEDVPQNIADSDKYGKVNLKGYMDFYLSMKSNRQIKDLSTPAGLTSTNKNYQS